MEVIDGATGDVIKVQLFVAVLGASSHTWAEATWTQTLPDWIGSHTRAFAFFGGVAAMVVSDNLKSGSPKPASTSRRSTAATPRWRRITTPRSCRPGPIGRATRPRACPGEGRGRGRRAGGDALDHRQAQEAAVLLARRAECGHRRRGRSPQCPRHAAPGREPQGAVGGAGAVGAQSAAGRALRLRRVEAMQARARLSRRGREALLLRAAPAAAREGVGAHHGAHRRSLPSRPTRRRACPLLLEPPPHDGA